MSEKNAWAARLRELRGERKWSQLGLAVRIFDVLHRHKIPAPSLASMIRQVRRWEQGAVLPDGNYQYALAKIYARGVPVLFGDHAKLSVLPGCTSAAGGNLELPYFAQAEENPVQRRQFGAWMLTVSAGAAVLPEPTKYLIGLIDSDPDVLPQITMHDVAKLDAMNEAFYRLSFDVGAMSRKAVVAQLSYAYDQIRAGVPGSPQALDAWKILTARLANTAAAMSIDAGRDQQAVAFEALGVEVAASLDRQSAADAASGFYTGRLARRVLEQGRPRTALDLAYQALVMVRDASPTTRHVIHSLTAEIHGALGDARAVDRELGTAQEIYAHATEEDVVREPYTQYYHGATRINFHPGYARLRATRATSSAPTATWTEETCAAFEPGCRGMSVGSLWETRCHLGSAAALMLGREPEEAIRVGRPALSLLPSMQSRRVVDDVRDLEQAAAPYMRRSDVKEFVADLRAAV